MAEEEATFLRMAHQEMMNGGIQLRNTKVALAASTACPATDCKGLYDPLVTNVSAGLGAGDQRSGLEALCLRQGMATSRCIMRWVHSAMMPADCLTKSSCSAHRDLVDFLARGYWRLVQDPAFLSANQRLEARLRDILDDGVERGSVNIQDENACESVEPDEPRV